jgi:hypothetical protein
MRIGLAIFALAGLGAAAAVSSTEWRKHQGCSSHVEHTLRGPADRDVQIVEDVCDLDIEYVYLQSRDLRRRWLIFSYERMGGSPMFRREDVAPTVTWLDRRRLLIEIDVVSHIFERRAIVGGIDVQYRVGHEVYPGPLPH